MNDDDIQELRRFQETIPDTDRAFIAVHEIEAALERLHDLARSREGLKLVRRELNRIEAIEASVTRLANDIHPLTSQAAE